MKFPTEWKNNPNVPNHQPDQARVLLKKINVVCEIAQWTWDKPGSDLQNKSFFQLKLPVPKERFGA